MSRTATSRHGHWTARNDLDLARLDRQDRSAESSARSCRPMAPTPSACRDVRNWLAARRPSTRCELCLCNARPLRLATAMLHPSGLRRSLPAPGGQACEIAALSGRPPSASSFVSVLPKSCFSRGSNIKPRNDDARDYHNPPTWLANRIEYCRACSLRAMISLRDVHSHGRRQLDWVIFQKTSGLRFTCRLQL